MIRAEEAAQAIAAGVETPSLRGFLERLEAERPGAVWRVTRPVSVVHEVTALQWALWRAGRHPVVVVERPLLKDGSEAAWPVVVNLTASRALCADVLGTTAVTAAADLAGGARTPIPPAVVEASQAPVKAVVETGPRIDLTRWPALLQHVYDGGPYLAAAHACTYDPDSGVDNTAVQRCMVRGPRELGYYPYPSSHNWRNILKWWALGQDAPVALWIGHHPAVAIASNAKLNYGESHWPGAGGMAGQPIRLVASETFGDRLLVPADAELVIEGVVPRERFAAEGPFGEFTGYSSGQRPSPLLQVAAVTRRRHPLQQEYGSGLPDMLVPDNMLLEARIYELVKPVTPCLKAVHVPVSGRRLHAYLQLEEPRPGEARDALLAAMAFRRVKHAIAVDEDVDIFDEREVLWAVATRVQADRDIIISNAHSASLVDPSIPKGARTSSKAGIDATLPPADRPGLPRPTAAPTRVPPEVARRMRLNDWLDGARLEAFPDA